MPIYEYQCEQCHSIFEEWCKKIDDHEAPPCPQCKGAARRLISHTSFALKGEGWYVTDYGTHREARKEEHSARSGDSAGTSPPPEAGTASEDKGLPAAAPPSGANTGAPRPPAPTASPAPAAR